MIFGGKRGGDSGGNPNAGGSAGGGGPPRDVVIPGDRSDTATGGYGELIPISEDSGKLRALVQKFKPYFEKKYNKQFDIMEPIVYRVQVVNGKNYLVKCAAGAGQYVHVKIFEPLPSSPIDIDVVGSAPEIKKYTDPLEPW